MNLADLPQNAIRVWLESMSQSRVPSASSALLPASERLSDRQQACLHLAAQGLASRQIAGRLGLSARTVDDHILLACRNLGVRTRIQAVALLASKGRRDQEPRSFLP